MVVAGPLSSQPLSRRKPFSQLKTVLKSPVVPHLRRRGGVVYSRRGMTEANILLGTTGLRQS